MDIEVMEDAKLRHRIDELETEVRLLRAVIERLEGEYQGQKAETARLRAALSEQEAVTALTRILAEYHNAGAERYGEALERIVEVGRGKGYAARIAVAALARERPDEDAP